MTIFSQIPILEHNWAWYTLECSLLGPAVLSLRMSRDIQAKGVNSRLTSPSGGWCLHVVPSHVVKLSMKKPSGPLGSPPTDPVSGSLSCVLRVTLTHGSLPACARQRAHTLSTWHYILNRAQVDRHGHVTSHIAQSLGHFRLIAQDLICGERIVEGESQMVRNNS